MFSAAGGAVIALGDKQAGCNNIINLLTTTGSERRSSEASVIRQFTVGLLCCLSAGLLVFALQVKRCICQSPSAFGIVQCAKGQAASVRGYQHRNRRSAFAPRFH